MPDQSQTTDRYGAALRAAVRVMERDLIPAGVWGQISVKTTAEAIQAALAAADAVQNIEPCGFPWRSFRLADWSIVGMNHYRQDGERRLFVSMERQGRCIKAEGADTGALWAELERLAFLAKDTP